MGLMKSVAANVLCVIGCGLIVGAAWTINQPLGLAVGGVVALMVGTILGTKR